MCGQDCEQKKWEAREINYDEYNRADTVIYKITHVPTGMVYIGQTTRSFTLRWWEHLKCSSWTDGFEITDLTFSVIEVLNKNISNDELLERETYWINHYESLKNGFNSVVSKKADKEKDQLKFKEE